MADFFLFFLFLTSKLSLLALNHFRKGCFIHTFCLVVFVFLVQKGGILSEKVLRIFFIELT